MTQLLVMRLADMKRVHPKQIEATCSKCGEIVAVYPSGQQIMRDNPGIKLICQECRQPVDISILAPGALEEPFQTNKKQ